MWRASRMRSPAPPVMALRALVVPPAALSPERSLSGFARHRPVQPGAADAKHRAEEARTLHVVVLHGAQHVAQSQRLEEPRVLESAADTQRRALVRRPLGELDRLAAR